MRTCALKILITEYIMDKDSLKELQADVDGLATYEYLANHIDDCEADLSFLIENMIKVDPNGQFLVSASRYLAAIDREHFAEAINQMVAAAIDKDRERRYIGDLLDALYGADYKERAAELAAADNNFRRIYKRIYPNQNSL